MPGQLSVSIINLDMFYDQNTGLPTPERPQYSPRIGAASLRAESGDSSKENRDRHFHAVFPQHEATAMAVMDGVSTQTNPSIGSQMDEANGYLNTALEHYFKSSDRRFGANPDDIVGFQQYLAEVLKNIDTKILKVGQKEKAATTTLCFALSYKDQSGKNMLLTLSVGDSRVIRLNKVTGERQSLTPDNSQLGQVLLRFNLDKKAKTEVTLAVQDAVDRAKTILYKQGGSVRDTPSLVRQLQRDSVLSAVLRKKIGSDYESLFETIGMYLDNTNVVTGVLGRSSQDFGVGLQFDFNQLELGKDDLILLASDGVYDTPNNPDMTRAALKHGGPQGLAGELARAAARYQRESAGAVNPDDNTVIVFEPDGHSLNEVATRQLKKQLERQPQKTKTELEKFDNYMNSVRERLKTKRAGVYRRILSTLTGERGLAASKKEIRSLDECGKFIAKSNETDLRDILNHFLSPEPGGKKGTILNFVVSMLDKTSGKHEQGNTLLNLCDAVGQFELAPQEQKMRKFQDLQIVLAGFHEFVVKQNKGLLRMLANEIHLKLNAFSNLHENNVIIPYQIGAMSNVEDLQMLLASKNYLVSTESRYQILTKDVISWVRNNPQDPIKGVTPRDVALVAKLRELGLQR